MSSRTRLLLDFAPLAVFFVAYKFYGIMAATAAIMAVTFISLFITYHYEKKLSIMPLVTGVMVAVFGTLTLILDDAQFIKMKPTLVNLIFASVLLVGVAMKKGLLKYVLGAAFSLHEEGWRKISFRWGLFFLFLAVLNEYIWRNYSQDFWVNFKVFGMFTLTIVFTIMQVPLVKKYMIHADAGEQNEP